MAWVMSSKRFRGDTSGPPHVDFCVGAVKIAEIVMDQKATRWRFYLRLMRNNVSYEIPEERFETFGEALHHLHVLLNSEPPEGFNV